MFRAVFLDPSHALRIGYVFLLSVRCVHACLQCSLTYFTEEIIEDATTAEQGGDVSEGD